MAWIAVDADGTAYVYDKKPIRTTDCWMPDSESNFEEIQKSDVYHATGKKMKWSDEPIEIK